MKTRFALLGLVLLGASTLALADNAGHHHHQPQSFTEDSTRTYADGTSLKSHVVQTVQGTTFSGSNYSSSAQGEGQGGFGGHHHGGGDFGGE